MNADFESAAENLEISERSIFFCCCDNCPRFTNDLQIVNIEIQKFVRAKLFLRLL